MHNAHEMIGYLVKKEKHICDESCKYYQEAFSHRDRACVLSDVYSIKIGEPCSTYEEKNQKG